MQWPTSLTELGIWVIFVVIGILFIVWLLKNLKASGTGIVILVILIIIVLAGFLFASGTLCHVGGIHCVQHPNPNYSPTP